MDDPSVEEFFKELDSACQKGDLARVTELVSEELMAKPLERWKKALQERHPSTAISHKTAKAALFPQAFNTAVEHEHVDVVQRLLDCGCADVSFDSDQPGCDTALCCATYLIQNTKVLNFYATRGSREC